MKKRNRALGIAVLALSSILASCNEDHVYPKSKWKNGVIVDVGGKVYQYDEIYALMDGKKESSQAYYTTAKNILAQLVTPITEPMRSTVSAEMDQLHATWKSNARSSGTSYKEEKEKTLKTEKVETEDELIAKKLAAQQNTQNSKNFFAEADGTTDSKQKYYISEQATKDFVAKQAPYHVSHILAKVDATDGDKGLWRGEISSDNAKKIGDIVRMLATGSKFSDTALVLSDDEGSQKLSGELADTESGKEQIAMLKSTSYVDEFKLGLYAYDAYINPNLNVAEKNAAKASLRLPSEITSSAVHKEINETEIGQGHAYGIPLSIAYTMQFYRDQTKALDGSDIKDIKAASYARNILFNNYFNNHAVSFIYKQCVEEYTAQFKADLVQYNIARFGVTPEGLAKYVTFEALPLSTDAGFVKKMEEYNEVKGLLEQTDASRFSQLADSEGNNAVSLIDSLGTDIGKKEILKDERGNAIIVTRASASYQGIHFIVVNNDPFQNAENKYTYYRVNMPEEGTDYSTDPTFVNFVTADKGTTATYTNRINAIEKVIFNSDAHSEYALWEHNVALFNERHKSDGKTFDTVIGKDKFDKITEMIATERKSTIRSDEETLDSSWETYVQKMNSQQKFSKRVLPTVCVSFTEAGDIEAGGKCHVQD